MTFSSPIMILMMLVVAGLLIVILHSLHRRLLHSLAASWHQQYEQNRLADQRLAQDQLHQLGESLRQESRHEMARLNEQLKQIDQHVQEQWHKTRGELIETLLERLHSHTQSSQAVLIQGLESTSRQLNERMEAVSHHVNQQLTQLSDQVEQRLSTGFQSTNETFTRVMSRLATIDEAQKKIDGLTTNVVSLNQLLGDKRSRGALGEVQLEALVMNSLPAASYRFQTPIPNHPSTRPDCLLLLPEPTGNIVIDAKFPLENYQRQYHPDCQPADKLIAAKAFQADIRRHIDAIANKYILPPDTADCAMLFIPAESIFAEIHGNYPDLVSYSQDRRVWMVSPTTLMAVLNTARAVVRDRETREHIHIIQNALKLLSTEFGRFDDRMQKLAKHIKQVSNDVGDIHITSHKITRQFRHIEQADLQALNTPAPLLSRESEDE